MDKVIESKPTLCIKCQNPHGLTIWGAGSDREVKMLCDKCFSKEKKGSFFKRVAVVNRWKQPPTIRNENWTLIGITKRWVSPYDFCFCFCFLGIDILLWFETN